MNYGPLDNLCIKNKIEYIPDEPMKKHTSFKIGGNADRFLKVKSKEELKQVLKVVKENDIDIFIMGNGSNLLVSDKGIRAVVICLEGDFKKIEILDENTVYCGSGIMLSALCVFCKNNSLSGLEFAYGIPGTSGGAAYMNAGAYGGEMKDVLIDCEHMDFNGEEDRYVGKELNLSYRESVYSKKNYIITGLRLKLDKSESDIILGKMEELMGKRRDKQPIEFPSAGSVFKRPKEHFAAALIEECGLKGLSVGGAEVSTKHSGFIINKGNAKCSDVLELIDKIKSAVKKEKSIDLECEIKLVGEV